MSDTVERLTNALAIAGEEIDAHIAEIERLRAALRAVWEAPDLDDAFAIAQRALEEKS